MKKISVGILLPSSSIFPVGKKFEKGVKSALSNLEDIEVEFFPEFIGQGGIKPVEEAMDKLKNFHNVDLTTGWVSNLVLEIIGEKMKGKHNFLISNLGAHIPNPELLPKNVQINSTHLWQQVWSLGYWAIERFGSKGMIVGSVYDMGYCFSQMFGLGMHARNPDGEWAFGVCPMPKEGEISDPAMVLNQIEENNPDFVFAAFCGEEASVFLNGYIERGLHKKVPLLGSPFLLEDFSQTQAESLTMFTPLSVYKEIDEGRFNEDWTTSAGIFEQLGFETGLRVKHMLNGNKPVVDKRGDISFDFEEAGKGSKVLIVENVYSGDKHKVNRRIVETCESVDINHRSIRESMNQQATSWQNPYLGV